MRAMAAPEVIAVFKLRSDLGVVNTAISLRSSRARVDAKRSLLAVQVASGGGVNIGCSDHVGSPGLGSAESVGMGALGIWTSVRRTAASRKENAKSADAYISRSRCRACMQNWNFLALAWRMLESVDLRSSMWMMMAGRMMVTPVLGR